jgi:hypothetical protein
VRVKGSVVTAESRRALWMAAYVCAIAAVIGLVGLTLAGHPRMGLALAAGLMIGAASGPLALRSLASELPYSTVSMTRLLVQSTIALGVGYALGTDVIWMPMLGVAAALAILAFVAVRGVMASR